jgi:putative heme iron utilization protein
MEVDVLRRMRDLLTGQRLLALATVIDDEPDAGLLPYALRKDGAAAIVQASGMARHTRGMQPGAKVAVLIHAQDAPDADPLQTVRLLVPAVVTRLERETAEWAEAAESFLARFPSAEMTLSLGDFNLYHLEFGRGRYVEGFARAHNVGPDDFRAAAALE